MTVFYRLTAICISLLVGDSLTSSSELFAQNPPAAETQSTQTDGTVGSAPASEKLIGTSDLPETAEPEAERGEAETANADTVPDQAPAPTRPFGQMVTITSPIDDQLVSEVSGAARRLQAQAEREDRPAYLILELTPGSSRFGQVSDLVKILTSSSLSKVRLIAWIPEPVDGLNGILALACHEIVMHPDASLGDFGRGSSLAEDEQQFVLSLADRRRNIRLSRGIVRAMVSPETTLVRITVENPEGKSERRFVTSAELQGILDNKGVVSESETIKEPGAPGVFFGADSLRSGFLVSATCNDRQELLALYSLPLEAMQEGTIRGPVNARVIQIRDMIEPVLGDFVIRETQKAVTEGVNLLIYEIDSPGGFLQTSEELALAISELDPKKVTTVAWIRKEAISGAAVTALACDQIIMHPEARIGDAGVIQETSEGGAFERAEEKIVSPFLLFMGDLAKRKNRPPALLQAMIDKDLEVFEVTNRKTGKVTWMSQFEIDESGDEWVRGPLVPESRVGILLTLNGVRAHELGLAEAPCRDFGELRVRLGIAEQMDLAPRERTWVDTLVFFLNTSFGSFILVTLAIICIYIELHLPSGFFGILSAVLFAVYFWSRFLGGTAGSLELILFLLGIVFLATELYLIPGFGVFGVSGILLMLGSLVMASHTFAGMSAGERFEESLGSLGALAGAVVTVIIVAVVMNRFLPTIPFLNRLILTPPGYAPVDESAPRLKPSLIADSPVRSIEIGAKGSAASVLRPAGKAMFGIQLMDVVSEGGFIDPGTAVEVVQVSGNRIVVRSAKDFSTSSGPSDEPVEPSDGFTT